MRIPSVAFQHQCGLFDAPPPLLIPRREHRTSARPRSLSLARRPSAYPARRAKHPARHAALRARDHYRADIFALLLVIIARSSSSSPVPVSPVAHGAAFSPPHEASALAHSATLLVCRRRRWRILASDASPLGRMGGAGWGSILIRRESWSRKGGVSVLGEKEGREAVGVLRSLHEIRADAVRRGSRLSRLGQGRAAGNAQEDDKGEGAKEVDEAEVYALLGSGGEGKWAWERTSPLTLRADPRLWRGGVRVYGVQIAADAPLVDLHLPRVHVCVSGMQDPHARPPFARSSFVTLARRASRPAVRGEDGVASWATSTEPRRMIFGRGPSVECCARAIEGVHLHQHALPSLSAGAVPAAVVRRHIRVRADIISSIKTSCLGVPRSTPSSDVHLQRDNVARGPNPNMQVLRPGWFGVRRGVYALSKARHISSGDEALPPPPTVLSRIPADATRGEVTRAVVDLYFVKTRNSDGRRDGGIQVTAVMGWRPACTGSEDLSNA
ncbi:hypothetical protein DFH09DRAFT_1288921 [Mycena vulgaris]|nr:hypothetical protein DFH09DRAFT_1292854 [Mycena vulgaris]KAJ6507668.1 hypothetical protein DFH09DRAFT_1288921 [Mycena vulgaris]